MTDSIPADSLPEELRNLSPGAAIVVKLGNANYTDLYLSALSSVMRDHIMETKGYAVYVSVTNPVSLLVEILASIDVPTTNVSFVDVTSYMMVAKGKRVANTTYVESPTMLETIMLRVEYLLQRSKVERKIVIIDSISSLGIHNNQAILSEFLHILVNTMKSKGVTTVLLTVAEETGAELQNMLSLICDRSVTIGEGGPK